MLLGQDPIVHGSIPECVAGKPKCVAGTQVCVAGDDVLGHPDEPLTFLILNQIKCVACVWLVNRSVWPVRKCAVAVNETVRDETVIQNFP